MALSVSCYFIAYVSVGDGIRLRFVRDESMPDGWRPDLLIDTNNDTVDQPPSCYTPTQEVIDVLNNALFNEIMEEKFKL